MANQHFTCVLDAWRDGRTLYGRMHYYRTGTYTYTDSSFPNPTMNLGGVVFEDTDFGNRVRSGINVGDVYTTTFSRAVGGTGDRTVTFTAGAGLRSDFEGTWSAVVNFPDPYTAPSTPEVTILSRSTASARFSVSISSYGNPSDVSGRYIEAAILEQNSYSGNYRYATAQDTTSSNITVSNSSTQSGTFTIQSNTRYYYGGYATNTQRGVSTITGQFYTLPAAPVATNFQQVSATSGSFDLTDTSAGSGQTVQLQYRYKKHADTAYSNWQNAGAAGNRQTIAVTITGLETGVSYDVQARALAGSDDYSPTSSYQNAFTTLSATAVITDTVFSYDSATDNCICTFTYSISATGSGTYAVNYEATASDSTVTSGSFTTSTTTGTFQLTLPRGTGYSMDTWVGVGGERSTYTFTTPDFTPTIDFRNMQKDVMGKAIQGVAYGSMGFNAGADPANILTLTTQVYNAETNAWENSGGSASTQSNISESYSWPISFSRTVPALSTKHPPKYAKLKFIVTATNQFGLTTTRELVVKMPPLIWGKIIPASGEKLNIVGTMIKDKNGNLTDGRYYEPVKIK